MITLRQKLLLSVIVLLALLNFLAWKEVFALAGSHYLKVDVLDVGQGDSIFIQTPSMRTILIDGGPGSAVVGKLAERLPFWQRDIDVVVLTHPDLDHLEGLLSVLKKYRVGHIVWTGIKRDGQPYQEWVNLVNRQKSRGADIVLAHQGLVIQSGSVTIATLHPFENLEGQFFKEGNDTGIVSRLDFGNNSWLFAADISSRVEQELVNASADLSANVLKVAHHGSKYSSSVEFLAAVHPLFAVISVSDHNTYGHPTPEVLQRLADFAITTKRTDQDGDVRFVSDGNVINLLP